MSQGQADMCIASKLACFQTKINDELDRVFIVINPATNHLNKMIKENRA